MYKCMAEINWINIPEQVGGKNMTMLCQYARIVVNISFQHGAFSKLCDRSISALVRCEYCAKG